MTVSVDRGTFGERDIRCSYYGFMAENSGSRDTAQLRVHFLAVYRDATLLFLYAQL
jgi:hypothetical protein